VKYAIAIMAAAISSVSCGGSAGDADRSGCGMASACTGNIIGNWRVTTSCVTGSGTYGDTSCQGATLSAAVIYAGTATFDADMSFTVDLVVEGTKTVSFPESCLTSGGTTVTCAQVMPPDFSCTAASESGCTCMSPPSGGWRSESGTYTTSGSTLTTDGRSTNSYQYCVNGNTLHLTPSELITGFDGLTFTGEIELTRQ
jgi:hypothetical protein